MEIVIKEQNINDFENQIENLTPSKNGKLSDFFSLDKDLNYSIPFNEKRRDAVSKLSELILSNSILRSDKASVALAFWMRKSQIEKLKKYFLDLSDREKEVVFTPVGNVFHIAPSNVDTIFVYSWVLSFLCGNSNVVRVSEEKNQIVSELIKCINEVMSADNQFCNVNRIITYSHNNKITEEISKWCNHRVIWGGDETIKLIRPLFLDSNASERVFGSKFSYSIISSQTILMASDDEMKKFASALFNDIFLFDQMACSSPGLVFFVGKDDIVKTVNKFNSFLQQEIEGRKYKIDVSLAVKRINYAFEESVKSDIKVNLEKPGFVTIQNNQLKDIKREICGGGLFSYLSVEDLNKVIEFASKKDQTVTYFGFKKDELKEFTLKMGIKGVCRIVPVGEALSFDINWDGYNLINDFVKRVVLL